MTTTMSSTTEPTIAGTPRRGRPRDLRCDGAILQATANNYVPIFVIAGSAYLVALLVIHALVPRLDPARLHE